jgi:hypothetical protein
MLDTLIRIFTASFIKEGFNKIFEAIKSSSARRVFRRAIRDVIEDEINSALSEHGVDRQSQIRFTRKNKKHLDREIRARFDPILQARD